MKKSAYGKPLLIDENGEIIKLEKRTPLNELAIQNLIYENPDLIPFSDIDESYNPIVSICKELKTNAGPLDVLMVSPNGEICIVETKLWKNPQARREVIADYLKEFTEDMKEELGSSVQWDISDVYDFGVRYNCDNLFSSTNREEIKDFFKEWLNKFVNVLRPRLKEMNP